MSANKPYLWYYYNIVMFKVKFVPIYFFEKNKLCLMFYYMYDIIKMNKLVKDDYYGFN